MADEKKAAAPTEPVATKVKRKVLTAEEKIAKAEADLKALRDKVSASDRKRRDELKADIAKQDAKLTEFTSKRGALQAELDIVNARLQAN